MKNAINWFEIPARDLNRAIKFYGSILNEEFPVSEMMGTKMASFQYDRMGWVGGTIIESDRESSGEGVTIYLNAGDNLDEILSKVEVNGGEIIKDKTGLGENMGYFAIIRDTEDNRVGLHGMK